MKKNVLWIDQNNDKEENKGYLQYYSEEIKDFSFNLVTSVKEIFIFRQILFSINLCYIKWKTS